MQQKKILLVEDSPLPQKIVKTILEQLNCYVDIAVYRRGCRDIMYKKQLQFCIYGYWIARNRWHHGRETDSRTRKRES